MTENNNTKEIMEGIFRGMDGLISSKTVVGEPITVGETTLIPLMEVSMGMGAGAFAQDKAAKGRGNAGAGALSSRIVPTAMLLLQDGKCKLINIKNQDTMTKLLDMLPDLIERISLFAASSFLSMGSSLRLHRTLIETSCPAGFGHAGSSG